MTNAAPSVFISYSHQDEEWKNRLVDHLGVVAEERGFTVWDDRRIAAGEDWKKQIEQALDAASVAVVLVSVDFLNSRFVKGEEVPRLLRRRESDGLRIVPLIVRACPWKKVPWLSAIQARPKDGRPLDGRPRAEIEADLAALAEEIDDLLRARPVERPTPPSEPAKVAGPGLYTVTFEVPAVDARGEIVDQRLGQAQAFQEDLGGGVSLEMLAIPGGSFLMGSPDDEPERAKDEGPRHRVTLAPFFIGQFPVTQAQWRAVAALPRVMRELDPDPAHFKGPNRPVEQVSWYEAVEFCARLSRQTGHAYRLPSEAEWEYAARAGTTGPFHFGETITPELANYDGNYPYGRAAKGLYREATTDVGQFGVANAFGLYDVHGNVWEWVQDLWHEDYAGAPQDGRAWETGGDASRRVLRGGSWVSDARNCRAAFRGRSNPEYRNHLIGLRVVCSVSRTQMPGAL